MFSLPFLPRVTTLRLRSVLIPISKQIVFCELSPQTGVLPASSHLVRLVLNSARATSVPLVVSSGQHTVSQRLSLVPRLAVYW